MTIAVVGVGALGGFYGGLLARQGQDVHFLLRSDYQAVKQQGLTINTPPGDFHLDAPQIYRATNDMPMPELVFIGLKTTANDHLADLLTPLVGPDTWLLTAQNGLGNEEALAQLFGEQRVAGGLAFLCANRIAPGVIHHLDYGRLTIGNYQRPADDRLRRFAAIMNDAGQAANITCDVADDLLNVRWKKELWNVPFNGLSALLDRTVDKIIADPALNDRCWRLMREIQAIAAAEGHTLTDDDLAQNMARTEVMKPYYTSMHLDRRQGRPMEIESIFGEPLRRAQSRGLATPELEALTHALRRLDATTPTD